MLAYLIGETFSCNVNGFKGRGSECEGTNKRKNKAESCKIDTADHPPDIGVFIPQ